MSDADDSKPAALPPTPSSTSSTATSSSKPLVLNGHDDSSTTSSGLGTAATTSTTPRTPRIRFDDESDLVAGTSSSSSATAPTMYPSGRRRVQFSPQSQVLIDESERLLQQRPSVGDFRSKRATASSSALESTVGDDDDEFGGVPGTSNYLLSPSRYRRSPLVPSASAAVLGDLATTPRYPLHTPAFPRIDMDDVRDEMVREKKPAWRELQESVKDSYRKPQRTAERHKDMNEFLDVNLSRRRARRSQSPFTTLNSEGFLPRAPSWFASGAMQPRGLGTSASMANIDTAGSGPYAAPALPRSKGIESRYDKMVDDVELRLLKTTLLPEYMKTVTKYEFRRGPQPSSGSVAEGILSDAEIAEFAPNPFYSRPSRRDPDYFDFDLEHSVNMYRKPEGRYYPRGPQEWENKVIGEVRAKGDAPIAGHMFTRPNTDYRSTGTSYLSAALRTPAFWEHRFRNIGKQVLDTNPVSLASIERNRPTANKFNTYKDPDFEGLSDPED